MVHQKEEPSAVSKFNYLKSLLTGAVLKSVAGLTLSTYNYEEAVTILGKNFGNCQQIIAKHMDQLQNVSPVTSANNLTCLCHLFNCVETHIRSLRSHGLLLTRMAACCHLCCSTNYPLIYVFSSAGRCLRKTGVWTRF